MHSVAVLSSGYLQKTQLQINSIQFQITTNSTLERSCKHFTIRILTYSELSFIQNVMGGIFHSFCFVFYHVVDSLFHSITNPVIPHLLFATHETTIHRPRVHPLTNSDPKALTVIK